MATFVKIGTTTMLVDNIRDLQIRSTGKTAMFQTTQPRHTLHINNRGKPCYRGTKEECELLRERVLDTLRSFFDVDVIDLSEGLSQTTEETGDPDD